MFVDQGIDQVTGETLSYNGSQDGGSGTGRQSQAQKRRNRTNYRCSKCGQPKRGHICPYQPRILRADGEKPPETRTVGCQIEIDSRLVVRHLDLQAQGLPESYGEQQSETVSPIVEVPPAMQVAIQSQHPTSQQQPMPPPLQQQPPMQPPPQPLTSVNMPPPPERIPATGPTPMVS
uniref:Uncharacterized protein n=1 Tax=Aureoumbra lagunensis TaxID=44058 RepID=A0A7S3NM57_9STRA|mmetsp:Transcript_10547/g.14567  ORF Transcript_10547/g.14567 Transcript_10547/m.14567 type:complete len:176 (-) Transcript_10547:308-835(-)